MGRQCAVTGKKTTVGRRIVRKGLSKKKGGIGLHVTSATKRTFKPNLQRVKVRDENGTVKRCGFPQKRFVLVRLQKHKLDQF